MTFHFALDEPWDMMKAQILSRVTKVGSENKKVPPFECCDVFFSVKDFGKTTKLSLTNKAGFKTLKDHAAKLPQGKAQVQLFVDEHEEDKLATAHFCATAITQGVWADNLKCTRWAKNSWVFARQARNSRITWGEDIITLMKRHISTTTSWVKSVVSHLVDSQYGFKASTKPHVHLANKHLAQCLLDNFGMCYMNLDADKRDSLYKHPVIQMTLNSAWFSGIGDLGPCFSNLFRPLPIPAISLLLAADIDFDRDDYTDVLDKHINNLQKFNDICKAANSDLFDAIRTDLLDTAQAHANAKLEDEEDGENGGPPPARKMLADSVFLGAINRYRSRSRASSDATSGPATECEDEDE
ncbi:hypothetical protein CONPUDRAFT_157507 [Coniophora puteana RWD-64-598 SS2]|uniref:DUF6532 domain-containing protein n=1 Tax=Coniophora puteana (strain RWD-64-598) TaxID=741705 RepID=A0A5M3MDN7_CONPW|nr:uncharacterized protein CONPUDRAFT_157507 [Coniophora puteana RWD-64-598 SS2]EIW77243.1 hypothetical protein CONPUDRAFT_157507 [Coniophora puteana RWD-64-598 SS2]